MKKYIVPAALLFALTATSQNTFLNQEIIGTNDLFGTSRYVGMGGALGALGADISTMSSNPAGVGMMKRKFDVSFTLGPSWQKDNSVSDQYSRTHCSFDQIGFVTSLLGSSTAKDEGLINLNFAFNYQKKADYNRSFLCGGDATASYADQLCNMLNNYPDGLSNISNYSLYGAAYNGFLLDKYTTQSGVTNYYVPEDYQSSGNSTIRHSWGALKGFDFNISGNYNNRVFFGVTVGLDHVNFHQYTSYIENRNDMGTKGYPIQDFNIETEERVKGLGVNVKAGVIVRPIEDNPFRIGLTVETPTWYNLSYYTPMQNVWGKYDSEGNYDFNEGSYYSTSSQTDNSLDYKLTTPWKFRASLGTTVADILAFGLEYEYAAYNWTSMGYPSSTVYYDSWGYEYWRTTENKDRAMNDNTHSMMKGQHTVKFGFEVKPVSSFAIRLGYNFISSPYENGATWSPTVANVTWQYPTDLSWTTFGNTHIATAGIGYRWKNIYADLAYKYRYQKAEYTSFNADFCTNGGTNPSRELDMTRHNIAITMGLKF